MKNTHGVPIVLATGKTRFAIMDVQQQLQLGPSDVSVNLNGAVVFDGLGNILYERVLERATATALLQASCEMGLDWCVYAGESIYATHDNALTDELPAYHVRFVAPRCERSCGTIC